MRIRYAAANSPQYGAFGRTYRHRTKGETKDVLKRGNDFFVTALDESNCWVAGYWLRDIGWSLPNTPTAQRFSPSASALDSRLTQGRPRQQSKCNFCPHLPMLKKWGRNRLGTAGGQCLGFRRV